MADRQQSTVACVLVLSLISMILCVCLHEGGRIECLVLSDEGLLLPSLVRP